MGSPIPESLRWAVIEKWMLGYPRNTIAIECGISNGAVSSIVDDWRRSTGLELSKVIRDLGVTLRKLSISPAHCAVGLRVLKLAERIGLDENSIESFLSTVYAKCQALDIDPNHISKYIGGLVSLLEGRNKREEVISIQEIENIFEKRKQTNSELNEEKNQLESKTIKLRAEVSYCASALEEMCQKKEALESDLRWKSDLRSEMERNGLQTGDLSKLLDGARFFKKEGLNAEEMLMTFSNYKGMASAISRQEEEYEYLKQKYRNLQEMTRAQDEQVQQRRLKNLELDALKEMGFGLEALKALRNLVTEVAIENGRTVENGDTVKFFISDIEHNYDDYLRLRRKVHQLKDELANISSVMTLTPHLGTAISSYLQREPTSNDILEVIRLLKQYPKADPSNIASGNEGETQTEPVISSKAVDDSDQMEKDNDKG